MIDSRRDDEGTSRSTPIRNPGREILVMSWPKLLVIVGFLVASISMLAVRSQSAAIQGGGGSSAPGTWAVSDEDKQDDITGTVDKSTVYRVHNSAESSGKVKVVLYKANDEVESVEIDPGDSADITVLADHRLEVQYVDSDASGTYEVVGK